MARFNVKLTPGISVEVEEIVNTACCHDSNVVFSRLVAWWRENLSSHRIQHLFATKNDKIGKSTWQAEFI